MSHRDHCARARFAMLLGCSAIIGVLAAPVDAQVTPTAGGEGPTKGIGEIVVTAQKREQNLQVVPIAVTALTPATIQTNRITNLIDIAAVAPGVTIRNTVGGLAAPQIVVRGALSGSSYAGQDRAVSINVDGVYIGTPFGNSFDIPELERIETLRGPQGTLFGRNSTGGAINFVTADPTGKFGARQLFSVGNYAEFRSVTHVDLPSFGPFSAYVSYVHDQRDGDIKNTGAGTVWNYSNSNNLGILRSPKTLGAKDSDSFRAALKFAPVDGFKIVYKFDHDNTRSTPQGTALVVYDPTVPNLLATYGLISPATAAAINAYGASHVSPIKRPDAINNAWSTWGDLRGTGHTLTTTWKVDDDFSLKNISAYRQVHVYANSNGNGISGPITVPGDPDPHYYNGGSNEAADKQWSSELQANYSSKLLDLTFGGIYFRENTKGGTTFGLRNTNSYLFQGIPGNLLPPGQDLYKVRIESVGAYGQAELHLTSKLTAIGGLRFTRDKKDTDSFFTGQPTLIFPFRKSKVTFEAGANYKFSDSLFAYGKYSTGYISGGALGSFAYKPEQARSWEVGMKSDFLDRRVRFNLALFTVKYIDIQTLLMNPVVGGNPAYIIGSLGNGRAKGFEGELTVAPVEGLTLSGALTYSDLRYIGSSQPVWLRPKWTANLGLNYETRPIFGESPLVLHIDSNYRSHMKSPGLFSPVNPIYDPIVETGDTWIVNGRLALQKVPIGRVSGEIAVWARNLLNNRDADYGVYTGVGVTTYQPARTFGADFTLSF